jgi:hypothetical protein
VFCDVCKPAWIVGNTGTTSDCNNAYAATAVAKTANVT